MRRISSFLGLVLLVISILAVRPATATDDRILAELKNLAGISGASLACGARQDAADALGLFRAILGAYAKNGYVDTADIPILQKLGRQTAKETKHLFEKSPPVSCDDVHRRLGDTKRKFGVR